MNVESQRRDAQVGYTWGQAEGTYFLRNSDGDLQGVSENAIRLLEDMADGDVTREDLDGGALNLLDGLVDDGFVRLDGSRVGRVVRPEDVRLWPRVLAFLALFGAILAFHADQAPTVEELRSLLTPIRVTILVGLTIASIVVHEAGHYLESRRHFDPTIRLGWINAVIPVVVTETNGAWTLPKNRRRWISLAGPFTELAWVGMLVGVYHALFPESLALNVFIFSSLLSIAFSINPLVHGDGYWLLVDTFDLVNLRKRGIRHLRNLQPSLAAAYAVVSYTFTVIMFFVSVGVMYFLYGLVGIAWPTVVLVFVLFGRLGLWDAVVPTRLRSS
ncbi:zinc metalloprotease [Halorussus litoreus]|uniref:hypothetical protein n=1 Tax=Halorussus litoreus TaxID=1710536 RepID=UPI000E25B7B2|nr:hypothetical protein [Halorussus litoreus]